MCGETPADIETKLLKIKEKKQPIQPLVLIEGSILNIRNVFLYFDEVRYKFFSLLEAISTCFKIFHVFHLEYPLPSLLMWAFIQKYLFKISTKNEKKFPIINSLCNELNQSLNQSSPN